MRRSVLGVLVVVSLLAIGVSAFGLSLCDYRSPETSISDSRLSLSYRYFNDAATPVIDVNSGRAALDYSQLYDSPNYGYSFAGSAELTVDDFLPSGWLAQSGLTYRYYPFAEALFFVFGGLEASVATGQPKPGLDARVGVGLGRFTDVTPLAKAILIDKELLALGAIPAALPDDVLMSMASTIGRAAEYDTVKALVADLEALIEGVSGGQLDARALLSIEEIVLETGNERQCGWAIQGGVGYELIDPYGGAQNFVLAGSADAAFATSPDDQFLLHASFSGPLEFMEENTITASVSYVYELSDTSTLTLDYAMQRVKPLGLPAQASHSIELGLGFNFGGGNVGLQVSLTRDPGDVGWSIDVSLSMVMELL